MGIADTLWDEEGNFLGRDLKSWAKILGFYAVYYSFLAGLFWVFTVTFYMDSQVLANNPVGGRPFIRNSRLDMPGAVVHPFKEMRDERGDTSKMPMTEESIKNVYCHEMDAFFAAKKKLNENSVDCAEKTTTDGTCNVDMAIKVGASDIAVGDFSMSSCLATTEIKKPMFAIDLNKIIGWEPNAAGVHFQCYEYDAKTAEKLTEQKFEFKWLSESSINRKYFPFTGASSAQPILLPEDNRGPMGDRVEECNSALCEANKPYNKPFVAGIISGPFEKNTDHMFRCDVLSDRITKQSDSKDDDSKAINADLRKLGLGFVEFGYVFKF